MISRLMLILAFVASGCTPHFNRQGRQKAPAGLGVPVQDLTAQGGGATPGVTAHFRVSRVAIGGNVRRIQATTSSGATVQAGPGAPH